MAVPIESLDSKACRMAAPLKNVSFDHLHAMPVRLKFMQSFRDIVELNRCSREQWLRAGIPILAAAGQLAVGVWLILFPVAHVDPAVILVWVLPFFLIGLCGPWVAGIHAWFFKASRTPFEIEIDSGGVSFVDDAESSLVSWSDFTRWYETKNLVVLASRMDHLAIPKRCLTESWRISLRVLLREKLGSPASW